jgi:hypothetical protein
VYAENVVPGKVSLKNRKYSSPFKRFGKMCGPIKLSVSPIINKIIPGTVFVLGPRCHPPHRTRDPYPLVPRL